MLVDRLPTLLRACTRPTLAGAVQTSRRCVSKASSNPAPPPKPPQSLDGLLDEPAVRRRKLWKKTTAVLDPAKAKPATPTRRKGPLAITHQQALSEYQPPTQWSQSTLDALAKLREQRNHHAIVEIKSRPYHVRARDIIVTMRMNELQLGDEIELDRVRELGGEDYILQGNPYVRPDFFTVKAVVIEHTVGGEVVRRHWKRHGHIKVVRNRPHHTCLRITEISIKKQIGMPEGDKGKKGGK
ncbi:hypothetical protein HK101_006027 [Irineochytrium annulatum]|nr:hypothetical protein HK101_006027 [Irineochytrium annulatum]